MPLRDPSLAGREIQDAELAHVGALVQRYIPSLGARTRSKSCMYMLSPDEHFILDKHPFMRGVTFLAGLSGHGFKFAPVLGEALANYALDRKQEIDAKFFSLRRF
jgi:glycine/D-amino acid oxidase-like deaminating enzyme